MKGYFAAGVTRYPNSTSTFNIPRLIKCGDIEINPGPDQASSASHETLVGSFLVMYVRILFA